MHLNGFRVATQRNRQLLGQSSHPLAPDIFEAHLYIAVQGVRQKVSFLAQPVEKVQTANSDNLGTVKNQPVASHRKIQNAHF
jgi:hypothetical protein